MEAGRDTRGENLNDGSQATFDNLDRFAQAGFKVVWLLDKESFCAKRVRKGCTTDPAMETSMGEAFA